MKALNVTILQMTIQEILPTNDRKTKRSLCFEVKVITEETENSNKISEKPKILESYIN